VPDYLPHTSDEVVDMLDFLGLGSLEELFAHVPAALRLSQGLDMAPGLSEPDVADLFAEYTSANRATLANMSPEYGATMGYFPIDEETLRYLDLTGRSKEHVERVKSYAVEQGLFRTDKTPDTLPRPAALFLQLNLIGHPPKIFIFDFKFLVFNRGIIKLYICITERIKNFETRKCDSKMLFEPGIYKIMRMRS